MHSKKHFIANWKMNGLIKDLNHISRVSDYLKKIKKNDFNCTFCLPYTLIGLAKSRFDLKKINLGAQNFSVQDINSGPYTGSISINMLKDLKCKYVIIGHSELRAKGETNLIIKTKIKYALEKNLKIIFDACALGQLIDGLDKKYHLHDGKFINKDNVVDPNFFNIKFKIKNKIKFPYLKFHNEEIPILNLHMHSKNTKKFIYPKIK